MPIITEVKVRISMLKVDDRYCSFNYKIWVNGKLNCEGNYSSDHVWRDDVKGFKELLESGYATRLALEQINTIEFKPANK